MKSEDSNIYRVSQKSVRGVNKNNSKNTYSMGETNILLEC